MFISCLTTKNILSAVCYERAGGLLIPENGPLSGQAECTIKCEVWMHNSTSSNTTQSPAPVSTGAQGFRSGEGTVGKTEPETAGSNSS